MQRFGTERLWAAMAMLAATGGCAWEPRDLRPWAATGTAALLERGADRTDAPEAEHVIAEGLAFWDGRPSLGGVWVAAAGVAWSGPVLILDRTTGREAVGHLYPREGPAAEGEPPLRLSSRAAEALGLGGGRLADLVVRPAPADVDPVPIPTPVAAPARAATVAQRGGSVRAPTRRPPPVAAAPARPRPERIAAADPDAVWLEPVPDALGVYRITGHAPISPPDPAPTIQMAAVDPRREGPR